MDNSELPGDHERDSRSESPASMSGSSPSSRGDEMDIDSGTAAALDTGNSRNDKIQPRSPDRDETVTSGLKGDVDWSSNIDGISALLSTGSCGGNTSTEIIDKGGQPTEGPAADTLNPSHHAEQTFKGPVSGDSVGDRAKAYLKKKKVELTEARKKCLGNNLLTYEAINTSNRRRLSAPYLQSGETTAEENPPPEGDFFSTGDGRTVRMSIDSNLQRKTNAAFSFIPGENICTVCPAAAGHPVIGETTGSRTTGREVIVLSDQSYPPILPSSSELGCIRIIRLEHGNIYELCSLFLELLGDRRLCGGSILLIFSASHLARVGITAYIEDMVTAKMRLTTRIGNTSHVSAAPPMLMCGTSNSELIKNIFALTGWTNQALPEDIRLDASNNIALEIILENGQGGSQPVSSTRVRLPISIDSYEPYRVWCVGSNPKLPNMSAPVTESQEKRVVTAIIEELQSNLAMDLDSSPIFDRNPGPIQDAGDDCYLVVGSSNARRLSEALKRKMLSTGYVFSSNWRATKKSVSDMAAHITKELESRPYTAVIFHLLDNNIYFELGEDGSKSLPKKGPDGKYHVLGDLAIADKDGQYAILKLCEPLWEAAKGKSMVIISPMARFITAGCCQDQGHASNRQNPDFYTKMREELAACTGNIKDYLFTSGLRHGRVMDPARCIRGLVAAEIWDSDPIHPRDAIYDLLADGAVAVEKSCGSGKTKRKRVPEHPVPTSSTGKRPGSHRGSHHQGIDRGNQMSGGREGGSQRGAGRGAQSGQRFHSGVDRRTGYRGGGGGRGGGSYGDGDGRGGRGGRGRGGGGWGRHGGGGY